MNRNIYRPLFFFCTLSLPTLTFALTPQLTRIQGPVEYFKKDTAQWVPANTRVVLADGDQLRTQAKARVEVFFPKQGLVVLEENSTFHIRQLKEVGGEFLLEHGKLMAFITPVSAAKEGWIFLTESSISGVRGTEFVLTHSQASGTELGVFSGAVDIDILNRDKQPMGVSSRVEENQSCLVKEGAIETWSEMKDELKPLKKSVQLVHQRYQMLSQQHPVRPKRKK